MTHFASECFSFQFTFEANELWIVYKATCFKQKANYNQKPWKLKLFLFQKQPPEVFCRKSVLKNFANFIGKHLYWSLFFMKFQTFSAFQLFYKRTLTQDIFFVKFAKFLWTPILKYICEQLTACLIWNMASRSKQWV